MAQDQTYNLYDRFCKKQNITHEMLSKMIQEIESGKIDVEYGGCVIKQRIARKNQAKSGGYRCVILYRNQDKLFMVSGFAKKDRDNIDDTELLAFKELAEKMLILTDESIDKLIESKAL